jgi:hypothetical protein
MNDKTLLALSMFIDKLRLRGQEEIADEIEDFVSEFAPKSNTKKKTK